MSSFRAHSEKMNRRRFLEGSLLLASPVVATSAPQFSPVDVAAMRATAAKRRERIFSSQLGKPFVPGKIETNWQNRGDFTRHYVQWVVLFATRAFRLNEQLDVANKALADMCQYHLERPQTMLEIHSLPWSLAPIVYLCMRHRAQITPETWRILTKLLWGWATVRSKIADTEIAASQTWLIPDSENHHANHFTACFAITKLLAADPSLRDRKFDDGHTPGEHHESWTRYLREYIRQRAGKGTLIEIDSPSYGSATMGDFYYIHEFADDPVLKKRAGDMITLLWALWAEQEIDGIDGGGKTRCYPASAQRGGSLLLRGAWHVLAVGSGKDSDETSVAPVLPFVTCEFEVPDLVLELASDSAGRGVYEVYGRRIGLAGPGTRQSDEFRYRMRTDTSGILRYSYCTPDFIMGSLLCEARPVDDWAAISSQNRWHGVIFRGADDARIYSFCETDPSSLNAQWCVQHKGTLISQKLKTSKNAGALRVWFARQGLSSPEKAQSWFFAEAEGAWAAVRVVRGNTQFAAAGAKARGNILECGDDFSPVIIEVARKSEYRAREDFRKAVLALPVTEDGRTLRYTGLSGDRFTFFTDQSRLPEINGKTVNLAPLKAYDSPFVQSVWDSNIITLQKGQRKLTLDFNDSDPPPHPTVDTVFKPADVDWNHPAYATKFDNPAVLKDWKLEGGKRMIVEKGRLVLESQAGATAAQPDANHLVCWLTKEMPADFLLEFSVRPQDKKNGLNIVFFNTRGKNGESIFDPSMRPRNGIFAQYHSSDLNGYHISYWAGERGTANVRKNAGFHLVATGKDLIMPAPANTFQTVRLYKRGGMIRLMVDDVVSVAFDDDGKMWGPVWDHSGLIGLRQMAHTVRCEYKSLTIYPLKTPSTQEVTK